MKKSSLAVAALLTTLSAATIVPAAYAADSSDAQVTSGQSAGCAANTACAPSSCAPSSCAPASDTDKSGS